MEIEQAIMEWVSKLSAEKQEAVLAYALQLRDAHAANAEDTNQAGQEVRQKNLPTD